VSTITHDRDSGIIGARRAQEFGPPLFACEETAPKAQAKRAVWRHRPEIAKIADLLLAEAKLAGAHGVTAADAKRLGLGNGYIQPGDPCHWLSSVPKAAGLVARGYRRSPVVSAQRRRIVVYLHPDFAGVRRWRHDSAFSLPAYSRTSA
jgi:hypothetical protein